MVALLGKNGAGKSTLFLHLNGIYEPDEGQVFIDGEELKYDKKSLLKFRQKVGIVFQNPDDQIFAPTVEEDVAFGPLNLDLPMEEVQKRVTEALARVGMSGFEKKAPHHLSGGQQKRVAIAGIIAMRPEIMVLDEPTAGLDPEGVDKVLNILNNLNEEGMTIVISSHDIEMVNEFADEIFVLSNGEIIANGDKHEIFSDKELIKRAHLKAPITTEILHALKEKGFDVDTHKISVDELVEEIIKMKKN